MGWAARTNAKGLKGEDPWKHLRHTEGRVRESGLKGKGKARLSNGARRRFVER